MRGIDTDGSYGTIDSEIRNETKCKHDGWKVTLLLCRWFIYVGKQFTGRSMWYTLRTQGYKPRPMPASSESLLLALAFLPLPEPYYGL